MGKGNQFLLLLWKNVVLLKRSPVRAFFQISMPLFFIIVFVLLRAFVVKEEQRSSITYPAFDINKLPLNISQLVNKTAFSPNTSDVRKIMDKVAKELSLGSVVGFQNEEDMERFLVTEKQNGGSKGTFLGGVVFNKTLNTKNIIYKIRLSSKSRNPGRIEFGRDPSTTWNTQFTFPVFQNPGPRHGNASHGGRPNYFGEGFLSLQHALDSAIIKYKANISYLNTTVSIKRFPFPDYIHDPFVLALQHTLALLLMLSLMLIALNIVRDIVYEKEKKLKESMKMMGLNGWLHWLAWFVKYFIFLLITMALATVFFTVKFNKNGRVLNQSTPSVILVFFILYAISSIMFCFCMSVFFSKANIAAAAGGILWFLTYMPYFFVIRNYGNMGLGSKLASCLFSNVAMALGALLIGKFEGEGTGVQWSNLNRGPSIDDDLTLGYVFVIFVVDSIVYGLIAWYIEAVFPGDYGVPQPWYFPVLPSYWCGKKKEVRSVFIIKWCYCLYC